MSLTAIFINPIQNMCKNLESNVFGLRRPNCV